MVCDRCGPSREEGYSFCPECGNPLKEGCIYCAQYEKEGYEFCGKCGKPLNPGKAQGPSGPPDVTRLGPMIAMPFVIILLVLELGMCLVYAPEAWSVVAGNTYNILMLLPMVTVVGTMTGTTAQIVWVLLLISVLASAAVFIYQSLPMFKPDKNGDTSRAERTPLYWLCILWGPLTILELIIIGISVALGADFVPPDLPETIGELAFIACDAAVWEEVIARILPIGIPMAIIAACYGRKDFLRYLLGGCGISRLSVVLIVLSSLVFGFAHMEGWGLAKVIPTFLAGLVMGYLFVRFGVHASIMFHFITDAIMMFMASNGLSILVSSLMILILIASVICIPALFRNLKAGAENAKNIPVTGFEKTN